MKATRNAIIAGRRNAKLVAGASSNCLPRRQRRAARVGWDGAFRRMHEERADQPLHADMLKPTDWEAREWTW